MAEEVTTLSETLVLLARATDDVAKAVALYNVITADAPSDLNTMLVVNDQISIPIDLTDKRFAELLASLLADRIFKTWQTVRKHADEANGFITAAKQRAED